MHSTLLQSSPTKHTFVSEHHGPLQPLSLRDMEAKQLKSIKSYPETVGRSLTTATAADSCGYRAGSTEMEMEAKIQKAIDFKAEGHRCYKEKKFREAIGKYHRALLQLKGMQVVDGTTGSEVNLLNQAASKLTEEQRRAVESTEIECYDSLTGEQRRQDAPPAAQEPQGLLQFIGFTYSSVEFCKPGGFRAEAGETMLVLELLIAVKIDTGTRDGEANLANATQRHN